MRLLTFSIALAAFGVAAFAAFGFGQRGKSETVQPGNSELATHNPNMKTDSVVVAGGCFWCLEPLFEMVKGVTDVEVGYAGGLRTGVSYEQVCTGATGHAEAVKVTFDPDQVSKKYLLKLFFTLHDPTTKDAQGPDHGTQYRSAIFYKDEDERSLEQEVVKEIADAAIWNAPLTTTVEPLKNYTRAEEYHQDYYKKFESASFTQKMGMNAGYCTAIIEPKVRKFKKMLEHQQQATTK
jgi:peptide-methionine (S)-S-oxide reductase